MDYLIMPRFAQPKKGQPFSCSINNEIEKCFIWISTDTNLIQDIERDGVTTYSSQPYLLMIAFGWRYGTHTSFKKTLFALELESNVVKVFMFINKAIINRFKVNNIPCSIEFIHFKKNDIGDAMIYLVSCLC